MIFCRQLTFFKINFFKKLIQEHYPECQTVWIRPDLGPNCLQRSAADDKLPLAGKESRHFILACKEL